METLVMTFPTKEDEPLVLDYKAEFEMNGDSMDGTAALKNARNFDDVLIDNSKEETD